MGDVRGGIITADNAGSEEDVVAGAALAADRMLAEYDTRIEAEIARLAASASESADAAGGEEIVDSGTPGA